MIHSFDYI